MCGGFGTLARFSACTKGSAETSPVEKSRISRLFRQTKRPLLAAFWSGRDARLKRPRAFGWTFQSSTISLPSRMAVTLARETT